MKEHLADPCEELLVAIIERAVDDCKYKRKKLKECKDWICETLNDPEYFLFEDESEEFPSFVSICQIFNCHPDYLRKLIKEELLRDAPYYQSSIERLRFKIKREREIMRSKLMLWAWHNIRLKKEGLNELLRVLENDGDVFEFKRMNEGTHRFATYYMWIGEV